MAERQIIEVYQNGSIAVTEIVKTGRRNHRNVHAVRYDVWLVGKRGWRKTVVITNGRNSWRERGN